MADPSNILAPRPSMLDYQRLQQEFELKKQQQAMLAGKVGAMASGGATGQLADRLIAQGVDPLQALLIAKSGIGSGNMVDPNSGAVSNMEGILSAVQQRKNAEALGGNQADIQAPDLKTQMDLAEKQRAAQDQFNRGLDVKQKALDEINALIGTPDGKGGYKGGNMSGLESATGPIDKMFPTILESTYDAQAGLETLKNLMTTENLGLLKGVLSDTDMKILQSVGSGALSGSDTRVTKALQNMQKALAGQVQEASQFQGQAGLPPLMSTMGKRVPNNPPNLPPAFGGLPLDMNEPIVPPTGNTIKWGDLK